MNRDWLAVFDALMSVYTKGAYSNMAINEALSHHKGCKESFVRNYAKAVLRSSVRLDYLIDRLAAKGISGVSERPLIILRMGIYAAESLGSVPEHTAVYESVELAKRVAKGSDGFINGVLRSYIRQKESFAIPDDRIDLKYSVKSEIAELIKSQYGSESENILKALSENAPLVIRPNRLKTSRDDAIASLKEMGIDASASDESDNAIIAAGSGIVSSDMYKNGLISLQSLSSMMAVEAFAPKPGAAVLDICAAPGGKSSYMAEIMDNKGSITACDIYDHRLRLIDKTSERLGIDIINTKLSDGTVTDTEMAGKFDYVLADVPCSGLGVMASKPEIRFQSDPAEYPELISIQKAILKNSLCYAAPGGRIEYSTCTLNKNENEKVVESITESEEGRFLRVLEMKTLLPYNCKVGFFYAILEKTK